MAPMAARNSESASSGSGGGDGRRANRWSSGLHGVWPATGVAEASDVMAMAELPVGFALP